MLVTEQLHRPVQKDSIKIFGDPHNKHPTGTNKLTLECQSLPSICVQCKMVILRNLMNYISSEKAVNEDSYFSLTI